MGRGSTVDTERYVEEHGLIPLGDVEKILCASRQTVWRLVSNGHLPIVRIGRAVRIKKRDLAKLIQQGGVSRIGEDSG